MLYFWRGETPVKQGDIGLLIKSINEQMERKANLLFRPFDLTLAQMRVLFYLRDREGEKTTLRDIEEYFGVSHPTVTGILRRMEAKGLVTGCTDGEDRRCRVIRLVHSEPLEAVLQQMPPDRLEPMLTRGLGEQEIEQLRRSLITVLHNVQNR